MYEKQFAELELCLLMRNPGIGPFLQPPLAGEAIRRDLKRLGIAGEIQPILDLFAWHNGAMFPKENEAYRLGVAPCSEHLVQLPEETIKMLESLGQKVDPNKKTYGTFHFYRWDSVQYDMKLWKKFATNPRNGVLVRRIVPFFNYTHTHQCLAIDTDPSANGRIVSIQPEQLTDLPPLFAAYQSFEEFLADLIDANRSNRLLAWPRRVGASVDLPMPAPSRSTTKASIIPSTDELLLIRVEYSDDAKWQSLNDLLTKPDSERLISIKPVSDPSLAGLTPKRLLRQIPEGYPHSFALLADEITFAKPEHSLVVVDLHDKPGRSFRATLAALHDLSSNLAIANMDFSEFVAAVDSDGIFRGIAE